MRGVMGFGRPPLPIRAANQDGWAGHDAWFRATTASIPVGWADGVRRPLFPPTEDVRRELGPPLASLTWKKLMPSQLHISDPD